jgi:hypothetical protein
LAALSTSQLKLKIRMRAKGMKKKNPRNPSGMNHNNIRVVQVRAWAVEEAELIIARSLLEVNKFMSLLEHSLRPGLDPGVPILGNLIR